MPNIAELASQFGVTEAEIKKYIQVFNSFDSSKDGKITVDELKTGLNSFGFNVTLEEAKKMVKFADANKDNQIDLTEFLIVVTNAVKAKQTDMEKEALQAFSVFDTNRDGYITMDELRKTMSKLGQPLSEK